MYWVIYSMYWVEHSIYCFEWTLVMVPTDLESQGKPGKKMFRELFLFLQKVRESLRTFLKCWLSWKLKKTLWFSSEKCSDSHFMLQVKLLSKCLKLCRKFVFRSGKKLGNFFSDFWWEPCFLYLMYWAEPSVYWGGLIVFYSLQSQCISSINLLQDTFNIEHRDHQ